MHKQLLLGREMFSYVLSYLIYSYSQRLEELLIRSVHSLSLMNQANSPPSTYACLCL